jgi:hypothetical protein
MVMRQSTSIQSEAWNEIHHGALFALASVSWRPIEPLGGSRHRAMNSSIDPPPQEGSRDMRVMMAVAVTAIILFSSTAAASNAEDLSQCSDRNKLNDISVDARLVAIEFYYDGLTDGLTDSARKTCYEVHASNREPAIANKTLKLIERDCLPIAQAARIASEGACP